MHARHEFRRVLASACAAFGVKGRVVGLVEARVTPHGADRESDVGSADGRGADPVDVGVEGSRSAPEIIGLC